MTGESVVLVISPSPYMTNKIQQALEEIGGYRIITCKSPANAFELAHKDFISTCILDIFHPEFPLQAVTNELINIQEEINFILIVTDQGTQNSVTGTLPPTLLTRTFTTDQLSAALGQKKQDQISAGVSNSQSDQPLETPESGAPTQHLTSPELQSWSGTGDDTNPDQQVEDLPVDAPPVEMLVLKRKQLLIHKGNLPSDTIQELVDLVNSFSKTSPQNLQKKFVPGLQKSSRGDIVRLIQLKSIPEKHLLYMVSISKDTDLVQLYEPDIPFSKIRRQTILILHKLQEMQSTVALEYHPSQLEVEKQGQDRSDEGEILPNVIEDTASTTNHVKDEEMPSPEPQPAKDTSYQDISATENPWIGEPLQVNLSEPEQTASHPGTVVDSNSTLSQVPFGHYITYSCLLIPRMPQHMLTSNLASYLFAWMGQLCLAYGWRLEHLSIHDNHIQLITSAPLTTSPAFLVRTLRQKTSQYIFNQFPPLSSENPSGDFWAPGFFIAGGNHTIESHQIDRYVSEIREHQGVFPATPN